MSDSVSSKMIEKLKAYKNNANECIFFKYIYDTDDIRMDVGKTNNSKKTSVECDDDTFHPEYTHQIFGDDEIIFGFKNLRVDYYLTPGGLDAYIGLSFKEKITPQRFEGIEPDDVYGAFTEFGCSPGFTRNLDTFVSEKLKQDAEFKPYGVKIHEYTRQNVDDGPNVRKFEIYKVDAINSCDQMTSQKFIDYLDRVQTMLVYAIETSNFLDTDDLQWSHFFVYEKWQRNGSLAYATIGYASVYNYYAYPDKTRERISQLHILPPFQGEAHGAELIESIYRDACANPTTIDITAESPSVEFIRLRDFVTCKMCSTLESFSDKSQLAGGFSSKMAQEALKRFKIPKLQSRRCYEILRMAATNQNNENEWRDFRLDLKKRFYLPFIRRSKCARNAGGLAQEAKKDLEKVEEEPDEVTTIGFGNSSSKTATSQISSKFNDRFGAASSTGAQTIGFSSKMTPTANSSTSATATKSVSFQQAPPKKTTFKATVQTLNASNSSATSNDDSDNDDDANTSAGGAPNDPENLFVNEQERKKYLESQFQETITDYQRILKRLETCNVILIK